MSTQNNPVVACFCFVDSYGLLAVRRPWNGIEYLGLPADELRPDELVEDCAMRIIAPHDKYVSDIALICRKGLGRCIHLGDEEGHEWHGQPATLSIFSFPDADIVAPMTAMATRIVQKLDQYGEFGPPLDVTILALQRILTGQDKRLVAATG